MTHSSIISHLYSNFSHYRALWEKEWERIQEFGALVFQPEKGRNWGQRRRGGVLPPDVQAAIELTAICCSPLSLAGYINQ